MEKTGFRIQAKNEGVAEIFIYDEIGVWGITANNFIRSYKEKVMASTTTINLHINSPGGYVFDGNAIYAFLKAQQRTINTFIEGIAASVASVIAMAGDTITISSNSMLMIHNPSNTVIGESKDMRKMADILDKIKDTILIVYKDKTLKDINDLSYLMDLETWFTAEEAVAEGFADQITEPMRVTNHFDLSKFKFKNVPTIVIPKIVEEENMLTESNATVATTLTEPTVDNGEVQRLQTIINAETQRKEGINALFSMFPEPEYQALYAKCLGGNYSVDQSRAEIIKLKNEQHQTQPISSNASFGTQPIEESPLVTLARNIYGGNVNGH